MRYVQAVRQGARAAGRSASSSGARSAGRAGARGGGYRPQPQQKPGYPGGIGAYNQGSGSAYSPMGQAVQAAASDPGGVPGAPGAPAPFSPGLPFDFQGFSDMAGLDNSLNQSLASIAAKKDSLRKTYGANASGVLDFTNPTDPYSQAALLTRHFRLNQDAQTQNQFSSGRGYDGSAELQDARLGEDQRQSSTELQRSYDRDLGGLNDSELQARQSYAAQKSQIMANLAAQAMADQGYGSMDGSAQLSAGGQTLTLEQLLQLLQQTGG